jgi:phenylpyruvate tautomerase PptA (4-oxalocrotonate tautomerase family)
MPMIDFTYQQGAIEPQALETAVKKLGQALLRAEGAPENERTRAVSWTFVHELPAGAIYASGAPAEQLYYRVQLTPPEGTLLHGPGPVGYGVRRQLIREVTEIVLEAEGSEYTPANAGRVWCLITEVREGYWGSIGTVLRTEDIAAFANDDLPQTPISLAARAAFDELPAVPAGVGSRTGEGA